MTKRVYTLGNDGDFTEEIIDLPASPRDVIVLTARQEAEHHIAELTTWLDQHPVQPGWTTQQYLARSDRAMSLRRWQQKLRLCDRFAK